jgi:hypothetical protein
MCKGIPVNSINSRRDKSAGIVRNKRLEKPNIMFIQDLKKKVGPNKYRKNKRKRVAKGNKSRKNEKNKISETKKIEPGKPKKIKMFSKTTKNSFGHI